MNFSSLFHSMLSNIDPLAFFSTILASIISLIIFRKDTATSFFKERHDHLIFPLFDTLEPILYQTLDSDVLSHALDIIADNKNLADGKLIELHYLCTANPSQENFILLCSYIDRAYDRSCRNLMLKRRNISYRLMRSQYKNKFHLFLQMSLYVLRSLAVTFLAFVFMILVLSVIALSYDTLDETNKLYLLIPLFVVLVLFRLFSRNN